MSQWDRKRNDMNFFKKQIPCTLSRSVICFSYFQLLEVFFLGFSQAFQLLYFQWSSNGHCFNSKFSPHPHLCSKFSSLFSRSKAGSSLKNFQGCSNVKCFCRCAAWDVSIAEVLYVDVFFLLLSLPIITFDDWSCPLF